MRQFEIMLIPDIIESTISLRFNSIISLFVLKFESLLKELRIQSSTKDLIGLSVVETRSLIKFRKRFGDRTEP